MTEPNRLGARQTKALIRIARSSTNKDQAGYPTEVIESLKGKGLIAEAGAGLLYPTEAGHKHYMALHKQELDQDRRAPFRDFDKDHRG